MRAAIGSLLLLAGASAGACGLGGASGGGSDHLPTAGAGPYGKPAGDRMTPAEEPYVVVDDAADLGDPSAMARDGFDLWFTRAPMGGGAAEIWYAHVPDTTLRPDVAPELALAAADAWEAGAVGKPGVVRLEGGTLAMYYQAGGASPAIGLATATDPGGPWTRAGMVLDGATDPSAIVVGGQVFLYVAAPDGSAILRATSPDGMTFTLDAAPVLTPNETNVQAFDHVQVGAPDAVGGTTVAGQTRIGLFYVGVNFPGEHAIGRADSEDGQHFERFFNGEPVLDPGGVDEFGPSAVLASDRGWLFFHQERSGTTAIAVALHP
jgi:hypothetical protein